MEKWDALSEPAKDLLAAIEDAPEEQFYKKDVDSSSEKALLELKRQSLVTERVRRAEKREVTILVLPNQVRKQVKEFLDDERS